MWRDFHTAHRRNATSRSLRIFILSKRARLWLGFHHHLFLLPGAFVIVLVFLNRRLPLVSWIEYCAQQGTNEVGLNVMRLHASVPHCTILGGNVMATLSEKKVKKQRTQKHILQETQLSKAQTGSAAQEQMNRDPSLAALSRRLAAIQKVMRQLKSVAYWPLVLDPASFSATVENMFAVAMVMDLALIQIVEDENGVAVVNWDFSQEDKEIDDDALMARIGDQGLNDEDAAQAQEQAACTAICF